MLCVLFLYVDCLPLILWHVWHVWYALWTGCTVRTLPAFLCFHATLLIPNAYIAPLVSHAVSHAVSYAVSHADAQEALHAQQQLTETWTSQVRILGTQLEKMVRLCEENASAAKSSQKQVFSLQVSFSPL